MHQRRVLLATYTFFFFFLLFCKLVDFLRDINRRSTRPDNFVTDVKMFSHVRPAFRAGVSISNFIFARRVLQFTRHLAIFRTNDREFYYGTLCMFNYCAS